MLNSASLPPLTEKELNSYLVVAQIEQELQTAKEDV
jgi:hypothetical protein